MKTFKLSLPVIAHIEYEVEAETFEEARKIAFENADPSYVRGSPIDNAMLDQTRLMATQFDSSCDLEDITEIKS